MINQQYPFPLEQLLGQIKVLGLLQRVVLLLVSVTSCVVRETGLKLTCALSSEAEARCFLSSLGTARVPDSPLCRACFVL